jgi:glutamyl-Q tRNA(Asp) synthetase
VEYVGRFAPSPTGPLHAGSIATAVASFLHARQNDGRWLLRIDDIDPPRIVPGCAESIVALLERLELHWDGEIYYQSDRSAVHAEVAADLLERALAFRCRCSRRHLLQTRETGPLGIPYDGRCRDKQIEPGDSAVRLKVTDGYVEFSDHLQGLQQIDLATAIGDYVVYRRDDLPAYHLAAVLDDADQGITAIVRGCDLLEGTAIQVHLAGILGLPAQEYWHLPVLCAADGEKLSKHHKAAAVDPDKPSAVAFDALRNIGASPPASLTGAAPKELWAWGAEHWRIDRLAGQRQRQPV